MCLLIETIRVQDRRLCNIDAHIFRMNASRLQLLGCGGIIDLRERIIIPDHVDEGVWKCRILYGREIDSVEWAPYTPKPLRNIRVVVADDICYNHKYADRSRLDALIQAANADDVLIVRNNAVTDMSFANVALFDGATWWTPDTPLLNGTRRQALLREGRIRKRHISPADLNLFARIVPVNAMLDIGDSEDVEIKW
jgi:4-amino-4-deoxychorismate lyase